MPMTFSAHLLLYTYHLSLTYFSSCTESIYNTPRLAADFDPFEHLLDAQGRQTGS